MIRPFEDEARPHNKYGGFIKDQAFCNLCRCTWECLPDYRYQKSHVEGKKHQNNLQQVLEQP